MAAGTVTYRGWSILCSCARPSPLLPKSARFGLAFVLFSIWGTFLSAFVYMATQAAVQWLHTHLTLLPASLLSLSLLTWFAWGFLLLTGSLPSLLSGIIYIFLYPLKVSVWMKLEFLCACYDYETLFFLSNFVLITSTFPINLKDDSYFLNFRNSFLIVCYYHVLNQVIFLPFWFFHCHLPKKLIICPYCFIKRSKQQYKYIFDCTLFDI